MSETKPALTADMWHEALRDRAAFAAALQKAWGDEVWRENDHALAALALFQQPFGFTWEDVDELHNEIMRGYLLRPDDIASLADRIAALLPPRKPFTQDVEE